MGGIEIIFTMNNLFEILFGLIKSPLVKVNHADAVLSLDQIVIEAQCLFVHFHHFFEPGTIAAIK